MAKFIIDMWMDGYDTEEEEKEACVKWIKEQLSFSACSVTSVIEADKILQLVEEGGSTDGAHHKQWYLNEVLKELLQKEYDEWVEKYENGGEYKWDKGIG